MSGAKNKCEKQFLCGCYPEGKVQDCVYRESSCDWMCNHQVAVGEHIALCGSEKANCAIDTMEQNVHITQLDTSLVQQAQDDLIKLCEKYAEKMCDFDGGTLTLRIPTDSDRDFDTPFSELIRRYPKKLIIHGGAITVEYECSKYNFEDCVALEEE